MTRQFSPIFKAGDHLAFRDGYTALKIVSVGSPHPDGKGYGYVYTKDERPYPDGSRSRLYGTVFYDPLYSIDTEDGWTPVAPSTPFHPWRPRRRVEL